MVSARLPAVFMVSAMLPAVFMVSSIVICTISSIIQQVPIVIIRPLLLGSWKICLYVITCNCLYFIIDHEWFPTSVNQIL